MKTVQEMFDKVATHLLKQNAKSGEIKNTHEGVGFVCMYRGPGGRMCAAGCLIPDDEYRSDFEGRSIHGILSKIPTLQTQIDEMDNEPAEYCLIILQRIHDLHEPHEWRDRLWHLARQYDLNDAVLNR